MSNPKISVVMPSYNQNFFIGESIESVLSQSYENFELIIVDGCSNDGAQEKILTYKENKKISNIIIEKDDGQADALRKGFNCCTGDIYCWLNSDDVFERDTFKVVAEEFTAGIDVLNGGLNVIDADSKFVSTWPQRRIPNEKWLHFPQTIGQPSTFFSAEIFNRVGGISRQFRYAMDYDLFFRFALAGARFHYIDRSLANFRVHSESKTMSLPYKFWKEEISIFHQLSGGKIFSGFYYWKFRGILSYIVKEHLLKNRKF
jgi:glycosyltransferase involved in cell wall biosynthesis